MKLCLLICLVTACNTGRVTFQPGKESKKETETADSTLQQSFTQSINPVITDRPLDILMVIDNSGSMKDAHENLSVNLQPLLTNVKNSDWRIVITTATFTDCLRAVIDKKDKDKEQIFTNTINGLTHETLQEIEKNLSGTEDVVRMATKALPEKVNGSLQYRLPLRSLGHKIDAAAYSNYQDDPLQKLRPTWCTGDINHKKSGEDSPRAQWLRDGSMLAILLITDEDAFSGDKGASHMSTEPPSPDHFPGYPHCGCKSNDPVRSCECIDKLWQRISALRTPRDTAKIYGLLNDTYSKFYRNWQSKNGQNKLFDMTEWVSTIERNSIRKPTDKNKFTEILRKISTDVATQMGKSYTLARVHDGNTSKVVFVYEDNKEETLPITDYSINGQDLIFKKDPFEDGKKVKTIKVIFSYTSTE